MIDLKGEYSWKLINADNNEVVEEGKQKNVITRIAIARLIYLTGSGNQSMSDPKYCFTSDLIPNPATNWSRYWGGVPIGVYQQTVMSTSSSSNYHWQGALNIGAPGSLRTINTIGICNYNGTELYSFIVLSSPILQQSNYLLYISYRIEIYFNGVSNFPLRLYQKNNIQNYLSYGYTSRPLSVLADLSNTMDSSNFSMALVTNLKNAKNSKNINCFPVHNYHAQLGCNIHPGYGPDNYEHYSYDKFAVYYNWSTGGEGMFGPAIQQAGLKSIIGPTSIGYTPHPSGDTPTFRKPYIHSKNDGSVFSFNPSYPPTSVGSVSNSGIPNNSGYMKINKIEFHKSGDASNTISSDFTVDVSSNSLSVSGDWNDSLYGIGNSGICTGQVSSTGSLPSPLNSGIDYYIIYNSSGSLKLADTFNNANQKIAIDITTSGTGIHTLLRTSNAKYMISEMSYYSQNLRIASPSGINGVETGYNVFNDYPAPGEQNANTRTALNMRDVIYASGVDKFYYLVYWNSSNQLCSWEAFRCECGEHIKTVDYEKGEFYNNYIYYYTPSNGLYKFNTLTNTEVSNINTNSGLLSNTISDICKDEAEPNILWLAHPSGLTKYNMASDTVSTTLSLTTNFSGLNANQFAFSKNTLDVFSGYILRKPVGSPWRQKSYYDSNYHTGWVYGTVENKYKVFSKGNTPTNNYVQCALAGYGADIVCCYGDVNTNVYTNYIGWFKTDLNSGTLILDKSTQLNRTYNIHADINYFNLFRNGSNRFIINWYYNNSNVGVETQWWSPFTNEQGSAQIGTFYTDGFNYIYYNPEGWTEYRNGRIVDGPNNLKYSLISTQLDRIPTFSMWENNQWKKYVSMRPSGLAPDYYCKQLVDDSIYISDGIYCNFDNAAGFQPTAQFASGENAIFCTGPGVIKTNMETYTHRSAYYNYDVVPYITRQFTVPSGAPYYYQIPEATSDTKFWTLEEYSPYLFVSGSFGYMTQGTGVNQYTCTPTNAFSGTLWFSSGNAGQALEISYTYLRM